MMSIDVREDRQITVLAIHGSVDSMTADQLLAGLTEQMEKGNVRLVADFSGVSYTSSAGLRALLASLKDARGRGGDLRLAGVTPDVHRVLQLSGFTGILKLYPEVGAAVASYGS